MNYLDKISIKIKLQLLFLVCFAIFASVGTYALFQMNQLGNVTERIYTDSFQVSNAAIDARVGIIKLQGNMKEIVQQNDPSRLEDKLLIINEIEVDINNALDIIRNQSFNKDIKTREIEARANAHLWVSSRRAIFALLAANDVEKAESHLATISTNYADKLEKILIDIDTMAKKEALNYIINARQIEDSQRIAIISMIFTLIVIFIMVFTALMQSILKPIDILKGSMNAATNMGELVAVNIEGKSEIAEMAKFYNVLVRRLRDNFWIKDGQNALYKRLLGNLTIEELASKAISYLAHFTKSGNGVLYLYEGSEKILKLTATFALTEKNMKSAEYRLGEGVIGQVALEKKPILLNNIRRQEAIIDTGIITEAPINIYAFPIVFEGELYGVIGLSSFEEFTELKQQFFNEASDIISVKLYSAIKNNRIGCLLEESEEARKQANEMAAQLQNINAELEEQQQQMEEQTMQLDLQKKELEKYSEALLERSRMLELANKYKSEFLANMSHELRTPLNSIILLSKLMTRNNELNPDIKEKAAVIHNSGHELLRLINEILDLSKIEAGKTSINISKFRSSELLRELRLMFESLALEKGLSFEVNDGYDNIIEGDKDKISQILRNFLSNAFKFTDQGSVVLNLKSDVTSERDIVFTVADTGIGIEKYEHNLIFEEFHQVENSNLKRHGGAGLGLPISKKLAALMNGDISIISELGKGSCFQLHLKNSVPEIRCMGDIRDMIAAADYDNSKNDIKAAISNTVEFKDHTQPISKENELSLFGKKILIVDDDARNIFVLASALEDFNAEIIVAENGEQALTRLQENNIDLILMDIMMPVMDGYEAIKSIRSKDGYGNVPIIAVTAKALKDDREKCLAAGANDYITKPIDHDALIKLIESRLEALSRN